MKQSPGFYAKICITCFVLSASDNYFSPSGFLGASGSALLLAGRRCQPASIVLRYLQDWKLWTTENKSGLWPKLTLQKTRLLTGAQCCEPVRLSQSQGGAEPMPQSCLSASTQPCTPLSHSGGSPPTAATDLSWLCAYEQSWKYHWKTLNAAKTLWLIRVTRLACEILVDISGPCYYFS